MIVIQPPDNSRGAGSPAPPCRCAPCFFGVFVLWVVSLPSGGRTKFQSCGRPALSRAKLAFFMALRRCIFSASDSTLFGAILIHDFGMV